MEISKGKLEEILTLSYQERPEVRGQKAESLCPRTSERLKGARI